MRARAKKEICRFCRNRFEPKNDLQLVCNKCKKKANKSLKGGKNETKKSPRYDGIFNRAINLCT